MTRKQMKEQAQAKLHGNYGGWSWLILIVVGLSLLFSLCTFIYNVVSDDYSSRTSYYDYNNSYDYDTDDYSDGYMDGYDDGYDEGYDDGFDDAYDLFDEWEYEDTSTKNKSINWSTSEPISMQLATSKTGQLGAHSAYGSSSYRSGGTVIFYIFFFIFFIIIYAIIVLITSTMRGLYEGLLQSTAETNVTTGTIDVKEAFTQYFTINFGRRVVANFLRSIFTIAWTLLFVVPGIIKAISYQMTNYLMKKDENLSALDAIRISQKLMKGYRMEYAILQFSFFGWKLLETFTLGLAKFYVEPYRYVTEAIFFEEILQEKADIWEQRKALPSKATPKPPVMSGEEPVADENEATAPVATEAPVQEKTVVEESIVAETENDLTEPVVAEATTTVESEVPVVEADRVTEVETTATVTEEPATAPSTNVAVTETPTNVEVAETTTEQPVPTETTPSADEEAVVDEASADEDREKVETTSESKDSE